MVTLLIATERGTFGILFVETTLYGFQFRMTIILGGGGSIQGLTSSLAPSLWIMSKDQCPTHLLSVGPHRTPKPL